MLQRQSVLSSCSTALLMLGLHANAVSAMAVELPDDLWKKTLSYVCDEPSTLAASGCSKDMQRLVKERSSLRNAEELEAALVKLEHFRLQHELRMQEQPNAKALTWQEVYALIDSLRWKLSLYSMPPWRTPAASKVLTRLRPKAKLSFLWLIAQVKNFSGETFSMLLNSLNDCAPLFDRDHIDALMELLANLPELGQEKNTRLLLDLANSLRLVADEQKDLFEVIIAAMRSSAPKDSASYIITAATYLQTEHFFHFLKLDPDAISRHREPLLEHLKETKETLFNNGETARIAFTLFMNQHDDVTWIEKNFLPTFKLTAKEAQWRVLAELLTPYPFVTGDLSAYFTAPNDSGKIEEKFSIQSQLKTELQSYALDELLPFINEPLTSWSLRVLSPDIALADEPFVAEVIKRTLARPLTSERGIFYLMRKRPFDPMVQEHIASALRKHTGAPKSAASLWWAYGKTYGLSQEDFELLLSKTKLLLKTYEQAKQTIDYNESIADVLPFVYALLESKYADFGISEELLQLLQNTAHYKHPYYRDDTFAVLKGFYRSLAPGLQALWAKQLLNETLAIAETTSITRLKVLEELASAPSLEEQDLKMIFSAVKVELKKLEDIEVSFYDEKEAALSIYVGAADTMSALIKHPQVSQPLLKEIREHADYIYKHRMSQKFKIRTYSDLTYGDIKTGTDTWEEQDDKRKRHAKAKYYFIAHPLL